MKRFVLGILAHVDAGKTTLCEAMLYSSGAIRRQGRVDRGESFLDTHELERERGITVFSKQAELTVGDTAITLLDTPGHVDFASEAERTLSVLDACVLVVSANEPIRAHTKTLWGLLRTHGIPTFLFVNKTDLSRKTRAELLSELRFSLSDSCADFSLTDPERFAEEIGGVNESLMQKYFDGVLPTEDEVAEEIRRTRLFPVYFGSALKGEGVSRFLEGVCRYTKPLPYSDIFGMKIFKVGMDDKGVRLSYAKITGGVLKTKTLLSYKTALGETVEEKIEGIRVYSGDKYRTEAEAVPGGIYALVGLEKSFVGQGFGTEYRDTPPLIEPVLSYKLTLGGGVNLYDAYSRLSILAAEDPSLCLAYDEETREITVRLMGEIQAQILQRVIKNRFDLDVTFDEGSILYRETIQEAVRGAGHFEPLRHYAEVHLLITPTEAGSGVTYEADCSTDRLSRNFQRLILGQLENKMHRGVLTGSALTDVKITLIGGRAHLKHTEGGDFRRAAYRAVRQGLMKAESILLEPYFQFTLTLPEQLLGRAMSDMQARGAEIEPPNFEGGVATLCGTAPVVKLRSYPMELRAYSAGEGNIQMTMIGYYPCHNTAEVIERIGYDPTLDERNPASSVFCKNGVGVVVPWNEADGMMHAPPDEDGSDPKEPIPTEAVRVKRETSPADDKELMRIFEATYGKIKKRTAPEKKEYTAPEKTPKARAAKPKKRCEEYLLVDGYNIIFAWESLAKTARESLDHAREMLIRILANFSGYRRYRTILVFDAYRVKGAKEHIERAGNITVVYTKEAQTADAYIERTATVLAKDYTVRVATSDAIEQMIVLGAGALRVSARELYEDVSKTNDEILAECEKLR